MARPGRRRARCAAVVIMAALLTAACGAPRPATPTGGVSAAPSALPDWFRISMTDVRTGQAFTMADFAGKVVLVEAMAEWCPTCREQQTEVTRYRSGLADATDVVSVSLDIDLHEDEASLKTYATAYGYDWRFAVAPLAVARALGNLYSAEYLNPPYSPILLIDRRGNTTSLPYGVKVAAYLKTTVDPYLTH